MGLELVRKMTNKEINTVVPVFTRRDLSSLEGAPLVQAVKTGLFVACNKPSAVSESYRLSQEERNHPRLVPSHLHTNHH